MGNMMYHINWFWIDVWNHGLLWTIFHTFEHHDPEGVKIIFSGVEDCSYDFGTEKIAKFDECVDINNQWTIFTSDRHHILETFYTDNTCETEEDTPIEYDPHHEECYPFEGGSG